MAVQSHVTAAAKFSAEPRVTLTLTIMSQPQRHSAPKATVPKRANVRRSASIETGYEAGIALLSQPRPGATQPRKTSVDNDVHAANTGAPSDDDDSDEEEVELEVEVEKPKAGKQKESESSSGEEEESEES